MPPSKEFPENRPKDQHGVPVPTAIQIAAEAALQHRIARDKAAYERLSQPQGRERDDDR